MTHMIVEDILAIKGICVNSICLRIDNSNASEADPNYGRNTESLKLA